MAKGNKLLAMTLAATLAVGAALPTSVQADQMTDQIFDETKPSAGAMFMDTVLARPLLIVTTVGGVALTAVSLPFSLLGGNTGDVADKWIATPFKLAFLRCLGCTPAQDERQDAEKNSAAN
ncbi:MAG: hypothetical protein ACLGHJ_10330 [Gammaproteobacteria bacterium]